MAESSHVSGCFVVSNQFNGIVVGIGSTVRGCTARGNGGDGVQVPNDSLVVDNQSTANGGAGIHATVAGDRIEGNHAIYNSQGILVNGPYNLIIRNSARYNPGAGSIGSSNFIITAGNLVGPILTSSTFNTNNSPQANFSF